MEYKSVGVEALFCALALLSNDVYLQQGDCSEDSHLVLGELLPECVIKQYDMSAQMWEERIRRWWANNAGQSRCHTFSTFLKINFK